MLPISRFRFVAVVAMLLGVAAPPGAQAGGIPVKTLKDLKAATVYVKVQFRDNIGPLPATGSGFVLRVDGMGDDETGYIVTNSHVVNPRMGVIRDGNPKLVFQSGTPNEKTVEAVIVASDPVRDLAILKVAGFKGLPRPIPMNAESEAVETMTVYSLGFPFGKKLALDKGNHPAINITRGTVTSLRSDNKGEILLLQIDAEINPGNSGGPIVDDKGNLVGVAVSKVVDAHTVGFAIPVKAVVEVMHGKVARLSFDTVEVRKGKAQISVAAGLVDPLDKVRDLMIYYRTFTDAKEIAKDLARPEKEGKVQQLQNGMKVALKVGGGQGAGTFAVERGSSPKLGLLVQAAYVNGAGQKITTPTFVTTLLFPNVIFTDKLTRSDPVDRTQGQPAKRFTHKMQAGKHYVIEMRGDPKAIDPWLILRDSAGNVLAQDDDSGGFPNALIVFSPARDDDYEITATVFKGAPLGPFSLRIREETALELSAKGINKLGSLSATDPLDSYINAPAQTFNVLLKQGKPYAIDMKSKDFDPYLRIENMAGVNLKVEDIGGDGHSTLVFTPLTDGVYRVVATTFDARTGPFDLKVAEAPPPSDGSKKVYELGKDGLKIEGKIAANDAKVEFEPKPGINLPLPGKLFQVKLPGGKKYKVTMDSNDLDSVLVVKDEAGKQLAWDDDSGGGLNSLLSFETGKAGIYKIYALSLKGTGNFTLQVKEDGPPVEKEGKKALPAPPGGVWHEIHDFRVANAARHWRSI